MGEGGDGLQQLVDVVQVGHQLQPEGDLGGAVVVPDPGLQADVQVQLLLGRVLGPGHLLEAVGLGVDELGVLGHGLVGVAGDARLIQLCYLYPGSMCQGNPELITSMDTASWHCDP